MRKWHFLKSKGKPMKWCTPPLPSSIIRRQNVSVRKSRLENLVEHIKKKLQRSNYQNWDYYFVQMQMIYMRCLNTMILSLFLDPPKSIRKNQFCHDTIHIINSQYVLTSCTKCLPQFSAYQKYQQWSKVTVASVQNLPWVWLLLRT